MKAKFLIKEIMQPWKPPFTKKTNEKTFIVAENDGFDTIGNSHSVFKLLKIEGDKALVRYHNEFTLKGYSQPQNKEIWISRDETKELSHLWGDDGLTKHITYKGMDAGISETGTATIAETEPTN